MTDERDWGRTEDFVPPGDASGNGQAPAPPPAPPTDPSGAVHWEGPMAEPPEQAEPPEAEFELFAPDSTAFGPAESLPWAEEPSAPAPTPESESHSEFEVVSGPEAGWTVDEPRPSPEVANVHADIPATVDGETDSAETGSDAEADAHRDIPAASVVPEPAVGPSGDTEAATGLSVGPAEPMTREERTVEGSMPAPLDAPVAAAAPPAAAEGAGQAALAAELPQAADEDPPSTPSPAPDTVTASALELKVAFAGGSEPIPEPISGPVSEPAATPPGPEPSAGSNGGAPALVESGGADPSAVASNGTAPAAQATDPPAEESENGHEPLGPSKPLPMGCIIAMANQKGGVGKTTTTINLGAALVEEGAKVLLVDFDPQGALSVGLGFNPNALELTVYDLLLDTSLSYRDVLLASRFEGLDLLPSNIDLAAAEIMLVNEVAREQMLKRCLAPAQEVYNYILIDCPPSLGLLTVNALTAASGVVIPLECEYFALRGMALLLDTIEKVRKRLNPALKVDGILATMLDSRTLHAREVLSRVSEAFGDKLFRTMVHKTIRFAEAPVVGEPILTYAPKSNGADEYRQLAREVMSR